jgi:hypothetical protein
VEFTETTTCQMIMLISICSFQKNNPNSEYWAIDAFECKKFGDLNPDKKCPEPQVASNFGDIVDF